MNLRSRLAALERQARVGGFLTHEPRCPTCGGPDPQASEIIVVDLSKGESHQICPDCARSLDGQGRGVRVDADVILLNRVRVDVPLPR